MSKNSRSENGPGGNNMRVQTLLDFLNEHEFTITILDGNLGDREILKALIGREEWTDTESDGKDGGIPVRRSYTLDGGYVSLSVHLDREKRK